MSYDEMTGSNPMVELLAEFLFLRQSGMCCSAWNGIGGGRREFWREEARRTMSGERQFLTVPGGVQNAMEG